jgi:hypothetical protein
MENLTTKDIEAIQSIFRSFKLEMGSMGDWSKTDALYDKLEKIKNSIVKCFSCGTDCDIETDYCYGCRKIVCVECAIAYDHAGDGKHGCKNKSKK